MAHPTEKDEEGLRCCSFGEEEEDDEVRDEEIESLRSNPFTKNEPLRRGSSQARTSKSESTDTGTWGLGLPLKTS